MQFAGGSAKWVGRIQELAVLRAAVEALRRGEGSVVWVEGEPGIGKSSLVAEALTESDPGWDIGWGNADQLTEHLPLRVMLECLQIRPGSPDKRRAQAAGLLHSQRQGLFGDGDDALAVGVELLLALVDELCADTPTVLVIDDLQWADEASLLLWHELEASVAQLPLLLVATCRPTPRRSQVQQVRASVVRRRGQLITLGPLPETDVAAMVEAIVGSPPGDALRQLTAQVGGNPFYLRELVDVLVRERVLEISPVVAELSAPQDRLPASLATVMQDRLSSVSAQTAELLRTAALLRGKIAVTDLAVLLHRPTSELAASIQEAVAAGILADSGAGLAFRHQLIRQALYESMPTAMRTALHAKAARELAAIGADVVSVAQQLSEAGSPTGSWARTWLIGASSALATRAPRLAAELLCRELQETPVGGADWERLLVSHAWALLTAGSYAEAVREASQALPTLTDPVRRADLSWVLARAHVGAGSNEDAIAVMRGAVASGGLPRAWEARMLAWLAIMEREHTGDLDASDATAYEALALAREGADGFATSVALTSLWLSHSVRRDHAAALGYIDQALQVVSDDPGHAEWRYGAFGNRIFTLENLDRWPEAELTLRQAREFAQRSGIPDRSTWVNAAVLRYWLGQWSDALAELGPEDTDGSGLMFPFLREHWPALLAYGVAALIAGRRDDRAEAARQLRLGQNLPVQTDIVAGENQDFLMAAQAVTLEQGGEIRGAMNVLARFLPRRDGAMTLIHQWLPDLVRLAVSVGDTELAQAAVQACDAEAAAETQSARAAAASLRCRGLLGSDPAPLRDAVAYYRAAGPVVDLPVALEDLAAVLAERGEGDEAKVTLNEAVRLYESLGAHWDIRRADVRLRQHGVRRGAGSRRRRRPATGWDALTPTEVKIAAMIAGGDSTSDIAKGMSLSRRTVQTYISRILAKLDAKGRVDIAREALSHAASL